MYMAHAWTAFMLYSFFHFDEHVNAPCIECLFPGLPTDAWRYVYYMRVLFPEKHLILCFRKVLPEWNTSFHAFPDGGIYMQWYIYQCLSYDDSFSPTSLHVPGFKNVWSLLNFKEHSGYYWRHLEMPWMPISCSPVVASIDYACISWILLWIIPWKLPRSYYNDACES